ncbi:hypothetical protein D3C86_1860190 [compost metagenome]
MITELLYWHIAVWIVGCHKANYRQHIPFIGRMSVQIENPGFKYLLLFANGEVYRCVKGCGLIALLVNELITFQHPATTWCAALTWQVFIN